MSKPRRIYSREYKGDAVKILTQQGMSASEALRRLGIGSNLIVRSKRELEAEGFNAFPGHGNRSPVEEELHRLRAENKRLLMERDILKKVTAFFAKEGA
jgi:transposase